MTLRSLTTGLLLLAALAGCSRNVGTTSDPTASAGVPPVLQIAAADFPSAWLAEQVGGDAVEVRQIEPDEVAGTDADAFVYVAGLDAQVDEAAAQLPEEKVIDASADVNRISSPRDVDIPDPYVWFDPVNVATMAKTVGDGLIPISPTPLEAYDYFGFRAFALQNDALGVDQRLQEMFNPCRIEYLVTEAPVLTYLARAYAFEQVPLINWKPGTQDVEAIYFTLDAEPAVRRAAQAAGVRARPIDTFTEGAPRDDLLQGLTDLGEELSANQRCPLVKPKSTDRPG